MKKTIFTVKEEVNDDTEFVSFANRRGAVKHIEERAVKVWGRRWGKEDKDGIGLDERSLRDKVRDILYNWNCLHNYSAGLFITADESCRLPTASWQIIENPLSE